MRTVVQGIGRTVSAILSSLEAGALRQVNRAEAAALRVIESNRRAGRRSMNQILEFCYASGDFPPEDVVYLSLEVVDEASDKSTFESAVLIAMVVTAEKVRERNVGVVGEFDETVTGALSAAVDEAVAFVFDIWARLEQAA